MTFRVLHVCTGNICRSPMAEHLMWDGLERRLGHGAHAFEVTSAGTLGFTGNPMQPFAHSTLTGYGIDGSVFVARAIDAPMVEQADLILTATRHHRGKVATLSPRATRRCFTLREFDRLLSVVATGDVVGDQPVARAQHLIELAAGNRGLVPADSPEDDDIEDPYQGPEAGYTSCARMVHDVLQRPLDLIAGPLPKG